MSRSSSVGEQLPAAGTSNPHQGYACKTCGKVLASVQALGGHQNAHRTERFALRRRQIEMKRQAARQAALLPRPPAPQQRWSPGCMPNPAAGAAVAAADDVAEGIDLTLKL